MSIINGFKEPRFNIVSSKGVLIDTIDLPLTNEKGLIESYEIKKIEHELIDFTTLQSILGYKIKFTLHYDEFVEADTLLKIKSILDYEKVGNRIILIPRIDLATRNFEVIYSGEGFELGTLHDSQSGEGHYLPEFEWTTKFLHPTLDWYVPHQSADNGMIAENDLYGQ
jgi:hypothetical protein